mgnify:CR=1 FL=1
MSFSRIIWDKKETKEVWGLGEEGVHVTRNIPKLRLSIMSTIANLPNKEMLSTPFHQFFLLGFIESNLVLDF